ncbi:hypothetical protein MXB_2596, partial [Myxobolus squamalis]
NHDSLLNDDVEILNKVIGDIHAKIKKNGMIEGFQNDLLPPIPEYLQKNGINLPNFCSLNHDNIFMLPNSFGRINHFSWGPSSAIVTGHISGACVNWVIDKKGAEKLSSTSFRVRYFVETPGTGSKNDSVWASSAWIDSRRLNDPYVAFSSVDGVNTFFSPSDCISESSWSSSGVLALSSLDGSISFLNPLTDSPPAAVNLHKIYSKSNIDQPYEITGHKCEIAAIKWISGIEDILLSVDINSNLFFHIFDRNHDKWKSSYLYLHSLPIKCMEIVPSRPTYVAIGSQDGHLLIVDCKVFEN